MEQSIDKTKPILVTGASGYIANWIIQLLLKEGLTVHGTVRNLSNERSVHPLETIAKENPQGKLKLFAADLMEEGSFSEAMAGCEVVMHTASPFLIRGFKDPEQALIKPAVEGTRNVLNSVNQTDSVRRVVLTSSVAGVYGDNADLQQAKGEALTEADWNTSSSQDHQPYSYSKVMAEREAWKIHDQQQRWHLVAINPSMVVGPALTKYSQSTSIDTLRSLATGKLWPGVPDLTLGWVDVRDVAQAHLEAAFRPDAEGRHIISCGEASMLQVAKILKQQFPKYKFPVMTYHKFMVKMVGTLVDPSATKKFVEQNVGHPLKLSNQRSIERLGMQYRPLEQTVIEHFKQLQDDGLIRRR